MSLSLQAIHCKGIDTMPGAAGEVESRKQRPAKPNGNSLWVSEWSTGK